jgi:hypothetical protein
MNRIFLFYRLMVSSSCASICRTRTARASLVADLQQCRARPIVTGGYTLHAISMPFSQLYRWISNLLINPSTGTACVSAGKIYRVAATSYKPLHTSKCRHRRYCNVQVIITSALPVRHDCLSEASRRI